MFLIFLYYVLCILRFLFGILRSIFVRIRMNIFNPYFICAICACVLEVLKRFGLLRSYPDTEYYLKFLLAGLSLSLLQFSVTHLFFGESFGDPSVRLEADIWLDLIEFISCSSFASVCVTEFLKVQFPSHEFDWDPEKWFSTLVSFVLVCNATRTRQKYCVVDTGQRIHATGWNAHGSFFAFCPNDNPVKETSIDVVTDDTPFASLPVIEPTVSGRLPAEMVAGVWAEDPISQLVSTIKFRKLLLTGTISSINVVVNSGVVPRLVQFLYRDDLLQLQFEAAWALAIIASGKSENTKLLIDLQAVKCFVALLGSPSDHVREKAVFALGYVSKYSPDVVLGHGALIPLLALCQDEDVDLSILRNATWTILNFCRGSPPFEQIQCAVPTLAKLVEIDDEEVLTTACFALSNLTDGCTIDKIDDIILGGVCPRIVKLLTHRSPSVFIPALQTVGNILNVGDEQQTMCIIGNGGLPCLLRLVENNHKRVKAAACRAIASITNGNSDLIQLVIDAGLFGPVVQLLLNGEFEIRKEAAIAIVNSTSGGTLQQIKFVVSLGCIKPLCDLLDCPDARTVTVCMQGIENIVKAGGVDKYLGLEKIRQLSSRM